MHNRHLLPSRWSLVAGALFVLSAATVSANEIQLAGIRLGQHALHVMEVYGQPQGVVKGSGGVTLAGGTGAAAPTAATPGAAEPGAGSAEPGSAAPEAGGPEGAAGGAGGAVPGAPTGTGAEGVPGVAGAAAAGAGAGGAGGGGGAVGGAPTGPLPFFRTDCPDWAAPVWVPLMTEETLYVYRRGDVVLGVVLDRDGYVVAIAVAGRKCDWARTAMWDPKRSIKLGDDYTRVLQRYGYPETTSTYARNDRSFVSRLSPAAVNAAFGGIANAARDLVLHYGFNDNVEFLMRDMKVVRIHIWEPDMRLPETRAGGGGGTTAAPGAEGMPAPGAAEPGSSSPQ
ncbi:hypothetical protein LLH03_10295 [bacterium]|nr:hypothetical protein [bacterium]